MAIEFEGRRTKSTIDPIPLGKRFERLGSRAVWRERRLTISNQESRLEQSQIANAPLL
jgi:hypothetical protein